MSRGPGVIATRHMLVQPAARDVHARSGGVNIWDCGALLPIIEEAGARLRTGTASEPSLVAMLSRPMARLLTK